ncbi:ABC transporter substrate-binding protein [Paenibacillus sp. strain BS8-2]
MRKTMMSMRLLTLLLAALLLVTACSSNAGTNGNTEASQAPAATNEPAATAETKTPVKLRLAHGWTGEVAMAAAFEPALDRFMAANEHVELTVETAPGNGIREKIVAEMAANDPPDIFLHWGVRDTASYIQNGMVADLTDLIEADAEMEGRYIENAYASATFQNRIYGLPIEAYMMTFVVNEQLFQEHGVTVPSTWSELLTAVDAFKAKGLIPIAANDGTTRAMLTVLNDQLYGESVRDSLTGKAPYGEKLGKTAEYAAELIGKEAFPVGMETMGTLQALELFNAGMAPMYFQHSWTLGSIAEDMLDHVKVVPFPKVDEAERHQLTAGVGYFVYMSQQAYEDEAKREAAWELAKFLAGPEVGKDLEEISGNPSPVVMERSDKIHPIMAQALALRDSGEAGVFPDHNDMLSSDASAAYNDLKTRLYLKNITPTEYAERFQQAINDHPNPAFQ